MSKIRSTEQTADFLQASMVEQENIIDLNEAISMDAAMILGSPYLVRLACTLYSINT